jgi:MFS family permease
MMASAYFIGWTVCSLGQRLGDVYGRKWITVISMVASVIIYAAIIVSTNLYLTIFLFFALGLTLGKQMIGYVYLVDFLPLKHKPFVGTCMNISDAFTYIILSVYFRFISKDWLWFHIFGISITTAATIGAFFLPESPQFYYSKGDFENAEKVVRTIARINGKKGRIPLHSNTSFSIDPRHRSSITKTYNVTLTGLNQTANFMGEAESSVIHDYIEYRSFAEHSIIHRNKTVCGDTMNESRISRLVGTLATERTYDHA